MAQTLNNIITVKSDKSIRFFRLWLEFLSPLHDLSAKEKDLAAIFLKYRFELSKSISDNKLLNQVSVNEDTKRAIRDESGVKVSFFKVLQSHLKKKGFLTENGINPTYIPNISKEDKDFKLLFYFDLNDSEGTI